MNWQQQKVGLQLIEGVLLQLKKTHPLLHLSDEKILEIIEHGDALYKAEEHLETLATKEIFDVDAKLSDLWRKIFIEVTDDGGEVQSGNELGVVMKNLTAMKKATAMEKPKTPMLTQKLKTMRTPKKKKIRVLPLYSI